MISVDILIKSAIEAAIIDLRRNPWILDDIFGGLANDPLSSAEYGSKETFQAKQWFLNTNLPVFLQHRIDDPVFPCITIVTTSTMEDESRVAMADGTPLGEYDIDPVFLGIRSAPSRLYDNLNPISYDPSMGIISFPDTVNMEMLHKDQYLVSSRSGKSYKILKVISGNQFMIAAGTNDDFSGSYISPNNVNWSMYKEQTYTKESVAVGIHAQSNPSENIWLYQIVLYIILRYKEAYFNNRGFELSTFTADAMARNTNFPADIVFSRYINMTGSVMLDFIKYVAPKLQNITGEMAVIDGTATPVPMLPDVRKQGWIMEEDIIAETTSNTCEIDPDINEIGEITLLDEDE